MLQKLNTFKLIIAENDFIDVIRIVFNILIIRSYKKVYSFVLYYFFDWRGFIIKFFRFYYTSDPQKFLSLAGNYFLDHSLLNEQSIVYSFGIGRDLSFEDYIVKKFSANVYAYDPTPITIKYINELDLNKKIKYFPQGVWTSDGNVAFYYLSEQTSNEIYHGSITNIWDVDKAQSITVPVKALTTLMKKNNHKNINLIKMDIEGSALPVLLLMFKNKILPNQVIAEIEFPKKFNFNFLKEISQLMKLFQLNDYKIFSYPRRVLSPVDRIDINHSIEFTAILESK